MKITSTRFFFLLLLAAFCFSSLAFGATLPEVEVQAVKDIAETLGKEDWNSSVDPCSLQRDISSCSDVKERSDTVVICNCSDADGPVCHVTSLCLKRQSLRGQLPPKLVRLPYLQEIDLTFNYLNGTIPKEWGSMKLVNIQFPGGKSINGFNTSRDNKDIHSPKFSNQLSGKLPPELGNQTQIHRLVLSSNNFTGELPASLASLTSLRDIRIGDNQFSGKIPDFIQSWISLQTLVILGSGLSGPIPSGISSLRYLTDLRISDLNGFENSSFPKLSNMTMKYLILRRCNINGPLPENLSAMTITQTLDLSFNKLSGEIPPTYEKLAKVNYIFLTGNLLTGSVPEWTKKANNLDISYNNFNIGSEGSQTCQEGKVNLFANSLTRNDLGKVSCLGSFHCPKISHSFHINCGGMPVEVNGSTYDDDNQDQGAATFYYSGTKNWAFSSTGDYMDNETEYFITSNKSKLSMTNVELYMNARVSPISLTYYGFCLGSGSYTGILVKKDFNIAKEAGGVGKAVTKSFTATVTNSTLEIRFYWAGKGTTIIPFKSVYGPLISAISVEQGNGSSISAKAVIGIVVAVVIIIILVFVILWWKGCLGKKSSSTKELKGLELQTSLFSLRQIKAATNDFDITNKIGEGGFGPVYKGCLSDGTIIAVKKLSSNSRQGNREFLNEIGMISALQHPCLVKLYGCCVEGDQLLLVYEYMENNSLAHALFGPKEQQIKLDWPTRHKICIGIGRGLAYLHEESRLKVVHRDIKATNVLLDRDLNPKISDFGLAKLNEEDNTHISTRIAGTYGYMAPEYAMHGYLTDKADVYSFGIVALEIISGRSNMTQRQKEEALYLLDWAHLLKEKGNVMELVDRRLGSNFNKEEVTVMINVAFLCTNVSPTLRPTMSSVVSMLEGKTAVQELISEPSEVLDEKKLEAMRQYYYQDQSTSMEGPWTASTTSATDLYPVHVDSSYFEKRD